MSSIYDLIGNTPLVKIEGLSTDTVTVFAKLEGNNPGGSVKDRAAYHMIKSAIDRGEIASGITLVEATSGNTGIALAMIASAFKVPIELIMPDNATIERVKTMEAYGATVILTPASEGMEGARDFADKKVAAGGYFMLNQFANEDNWKAHYNSTGPEIWRDTEQKVTHFVSAMGTTGTIMGTSRFLKEKNKDIQIIGAQPAEGAKIPGIRKWPKAYLPKIFEAHRVDKEIEVSEKEARTMTRFLAREAGIFCGMSSGGAMHVAKQVAENLKQGIVVSIVCDRGDRYLSSDLFD